MICVPLMSNVRWAEAPRNVRLGSSSRGLPKDSVANVSQPVTLDRRQIRERVGRLSGSQLDLAPAASLGRPGGDGEGGEEEAQGSGLQKRFDLRAQRRQVEGHRPPDDLPVDACVDGDVPLTDAASMSCG